MFFSADFKWEKKKQIWEKFDAQPTAENGNLQQGNPSLQLDSWTLDGKEPVFFPTPDGIPGPYPAIIIKKHTSNQTAYRHTQTITQQLTRGPVFFW